MCGRGLLRGHTWPDAVFLSCQPLPRIACISLEEELPGVERRKSKTWDPAAELRLERPGGDQRTCPEGAQPNVKPEVQMEPSMHASAEPSGDSMAWEWVSFGRFRVR